MLTRSTPKYPISPIPDSGVDVKMTSQFGNVITLNMRSQIRGSDAAHITADREKVGMRLDLNDADLDVLITRLLHWGQETRV